MATGYSIHTGKITSFSVVDYVLFSAFLFVLSAIGFYHAYKDRNKRTAEAFHFGNREMHPIPVALSLSATFLSSLATLGVPADIYTNGTMIYWMVGGMLIATGCAAHIFVPVFFKLKTTSCFQYIEMRFGTGNKIVTSLLYIVQTLIYMGFILYGPSLAFQAVTGLSLWGCMIGASVVCTLYTTLGGMKTVLWTDSLQIGIMIAGVVAAVVEGSSAVGGFSNAWAIAHENGRIKFDNFSFDLRTTYSFWSLVIGYSFFWTYLYGINQAQVQRASSLKSLRKAKIAMWLNYPILLLVVTLVLMLGIVMYAFYSRCDPVKAGLISRNDQLVPLFVMDVLSSPVSFGRLPGFPGLFLACVFSSSLSSISSGLNAVSAVVLDLLRPISKKLWNATALDKHAVVVSKVIVIVAGITQFAFAATISTLPGLIIQIAIGLYQITSGPIFGMFVAGILLPWTNKYGAMLGFVTSLCLMSWVGIGALIDKPKSLTARLPIKTDQCFLNNDTLRESGLLPLPTNLELMTTATNSIVDDVYRMSYMWYAGLGTVLCVGTSIIVSLLTKLFLKTPKVNGNLIVPIFDICFPFLPESVRKPLRFGVIYSGPDETVQSDSTDQELETTSFA